MCSAKLSRPPAGLRIGPTRLTHEYLRGKPPQCISCRVLPTVLHILTKSCAYENEQEQLELGTDKTEKCDECCHKLIFFLNYSAE